MEVKEKEHEEGQEQYLLEESHRIVEEMIINKIEVILKKHLLSLKENLQAAQNMIMWHEKELEIKEGLLKEFDFNLKKLVDDAEIYMEKEKRLVF